MSWSRRAKLIRVTFEQKWEQVMWQSGKGVFQAEGTTQTKVLKPELAWGFFRAMPVQLEQNKQGEGRAEGVRAEGQWDPVMVFLSMHLNINDFIDFKFLILHYVNSSGENY